MGSSLVFWLKKLASRLPGSWQNELKRWHYKIQILRGRFITTEPEYAILPDFIKPGDWVIDIGANVGHYTKRFSELVGAHGRVIAFEPVPGTFALLAANVGLFANNNVTLINAAASDRLNVAGISIPKFSTGLSNYFQAHLDTDSDAELSVLSFALDSLAIDRKIALVKIDAEGHESFVIEGMLELLRSYHPVLIVETSSNDVINMLLALGYKYKKMQNSPNLLFAFEK